MPEEEPIRYILTEDGINAIAAIAAKKGIESFKEECRRAEREYQDKIQRNTKELLVNYRYFKDCIRAIEDGTAAMTDDSAKDILAHMRRYFWDGGTEELSAKKCFSETKAVMGHVDAMLDAYRKQCGTAANPEEMRRYRIIKGMYLDSMPKTSAELAEKECITVRTVFRDLKIACGRLAVLIFGIYGFRL